MLLDKSNTILDDLMELFAGNVEPAFGTIKLPNDCCEGGRSRRIGLIQRDPINSTLFPQLSFFENLCFQLADKVAFFWQKSDLQKNITCI